MRTTATQWVSMPIYDNRSFVIHLPRGVSVFNPEYSDGGLRFSWGPDWFNNPASVEHVFSIFLSNRKRKYGKRVGSFMYAGEKYFLYHKEL